MPTYYVFATLKVTNCNDGARSCVTIMMTATRDDNIAIMPVVMLIMIVGMVSTTMMTSVTI